MVPVLNDWIAAAESGDTPVYASRDYHPQGHMSFDESGGPWPLHCIQDSDGARFHPDLNLPPDATVVTKGVRLDQDQNSAFDQTGLATELRKQDVMRVFVGGLAEDVCVLATALDGRQRRVSMSSSSRMPPAQSPPRAACPPANRCEPPESASALRGLVNNATVIPAKSPVSSGAGSWRAL